MHRCYDTSSSGDEGCSCCIFVQNLSRAVRWCVCSGIRSSSLASQYLRTILWSPRPDAVPYATHVARLLKHKCTCQANLGRTAPPRHTRRGLVEASFSTRPTCAHAPPPPGAIAGAVSFKQRRRRYVPHPVAARASRPSVSIFSRWSHAGVHLTYDRSFFAGWVYVVRAIGLLQGIFRCANC